MCTPCARAMAAAAYQQGREDERLKDCCRSCGCEEWDHSLSIRPVGQSCVCGACTAFVRREATS